MKKFRSSWFRVATAGATTDGREIDAAWITEMASSYNPAVYGARVWMEHIRGTIADSPFRAYGDVIALKAEDVDVSLNGHTEKRLALFAQIEPTADLVAMNKARQKIYTSIEVNPQFAGTGKAYLTGLGITDSPASLGTDVLAFAAKHPDANPYKARKQHPENLFSVAEEVALVFEEIEDKPSPAAALLSRISELFKTRDAKTDQDLTQFGEAVTALAEHVKAQDDQFAAEQQASREQRTQLQQLTTNFNALKHRLETTETQPQRPLVSGGGATTLTDC
ncbi:GPO family capsid scaffolding protein [Pseudomonas sp. RIT-PI-S]|uniref:GPO family capsid scaffolding protein n=1 Tax=Pseudomonas sp. RIT-PI-S TaxID=3035295 RepID=UPI0021D969E1|nr:GPO family capsid scaffolding protein [Pseudomonas sp. RIT-PI-S]